MQKEHARDHIHEPTSRGERIADAVAEQMGSWRFIIIQTIIVALWMALNVVGVVGRWDAYPFILLNLLFSTQAAYAAPIIMMAQNRQAAKDRVRDDTEAAEVEQLFGINREQLEILQGMRDVRAILREHTELLARLLPERPTLLELPIVPGGGGDGDGGDGRPGRDPRTGRYAKATATPTPAAVVAQVKGRETA